MYMDYYLFNFSSWKFENTSKSREKRIMASQVPLLRVCPASLNSFLKSFADMTPLSVLHVHILSFVMAVFQVTNQIYICIAAK